MGTGAGDKFANPQELMGLTGLAPGPCMKWLAADKQDLVLLATPDRDLPICHGQHVLWWLHRTGKGK